MVDHHGLAWDDGVPWSTKYLDSFYFAITTPTTVGCGDRSPHTDAEKMWVCVVELCRTFIFGVMAGTLTSIISEANELSARRDRELGYELKKEIVLAMEEMHTKKDMLVRSSSKRSRSSARTKVRFMTRTSTRWMQTRWCAWRSGKSVAMCKPTRNPRQMVSTLSLTDWLCSQAYDIWYENRAIGNGISAAQEQDYGSVKPVLLAATNWPCRSWRPYYSD